MKPDGAAIHWKYLELGGRGMVLRPSCKQSDEKEALVQRRLKEWIRKETEK